MCSRSVAVPVGSVTSLHSSGKRHTLLTVLGLLLKGGAEHLGVVLGDPTAALSFLDERVFPERVADLVDAADQRDDDLGAGHVVKAVIDSDVSSQAVGREPVAGRPARIRRTAPVGGADFRMSAEAS